MSMIWTDVAVGLMGMLGTVLSGLAALIWGRHIKPWLEERRLTEAAAVIVNAIEALYRELDGEEKLAIAFERLFDIGVCKNLDAERVREAVEAAYMQMHIARVAAGMEDDFFDAET